jgi:hypothetical protein
MDFNILNGWLLAVASAVGVVIWWLFRAVHAKSDANEKALAEFKLHCAETFVTSNTLEKALQGLNDTFKAVFAKLDRIEDKLDLKADK